MILYGKPVADKIYNDLKKEIISHKLKPFLAVILSGEDPESLSYIKAKEKIAEELGIGFRLYQYPEIAREDEIIKLLNDLNRNQYISGIVVQLPLPIKMSTDKILKKIMPLKDIDGFSKQYLSPAALAIIEILKYYHISLGNKNIVLVGRGKLVGAPLEKLLINMNIKVQVCDRETQNLAEITKKADIIISATGIPNLITNNMTKKDVVLIDAGTAEVGGKITGDVEKSVVNKVFAVSPVPGGVGPVTVACLMKNLVEATKK